MLEITDISKSFNGIEVLNKISFSIAKGEIIAILGPSGCGKSTLLSIVGGLTTPDTGMIRWDGISLTSEPPHLRNFGLMFQDNALFPHQNVFGNVAFGLKQLRMDPAAIDKQVSAILNMVGMRDLADRDVLSLSGGEQQRVALARTIAPKPRLLMLDEPLGSLDRNLREQLLHELRQILTNLEQTVIYVTHDQDEAFAIADRVAIMNAGKIIQIGRPRDIYAHPASTFVARFLGLTNILETSIESIDINSGVKISENSLIPVSQTPPKHMKHPRILVRPRGAQLSKQGTLSGILTNISFRGALLDLKIIVSNGLQLRFEVPTPSLIPKIGAKINLELPADASIWIEDDTL